MRSDAYRFRLTTAVAEDVDSRIREPTDGPFSLLHIARASGASLKAVRRAVADYVKRDPDAGRETSFGAVLEVSKWLGDEPMTCAELGLAVAKQIGVGRFSARHIPAPVIKKERDVPIQSHPYVRGDAGRSIKSQPGGHQMARLDCSRCDAHHEISFRQLAGAEQIDRKFIQAGWTVDPARCPTHNPNHREKAVSANPSPAAIKSQAAMYRLLGQHFDIDQGRYAAEWSDARIAKDTGVSVAMVTGVREEAFGPLKEPEEVAALARDIETIDGMLVEAAATIETVKGEVATLKTRLNDLRKRFAA